MAELGKTISVRLATNFISSADGYDTPDGYTGRYANLFLPSIEKEKGLIISNNTNGINLPNPPAGGAIVYYVMRGRDIDCGTVTYRTWTVSGSPDTTGSQYLGAKCGANPLTDIVVVHKYTG